MKAWIHVPVITIFPLVLAACSSTADHPSCDFTSPPDLSVIVIDAETGKRVCDARVVVHRDGSIDDQMPSGSDDPQVCSYLEASELHGTFVVSVDAAGFVSVSKQVSIVEGECHPVKQTVTLALKYAE